MMISPLEALRQRARDYESRVERECGMLPIPQPIPPQTSHPHAAETLPSSTLQRSNQPIDRIKVDGVHTVNTEQRQNAPKNNSQESRFKLAAQKVCRWGKMTENCELQIEDVTEVRDYFKDFMQSEWARISSSSSRRVGREGSEFDGCPSASFSSPSSLKLRLSTSRRPFISYLSNKQSKLAVLPDNSSSATMTTGKEEEEEEEENTCGCDIVSEVCMPIAQLVTAISLRLAKEIIVGENIVGRSDATKKDDEDNHNNNNNSNMPLQGESVTLSASPSQQREGGGSGRGSSGAVTLSAIESNLIDLYATYVLPTAAMLRRRKNQIRSRELLKGKESGAYKGASQTTCERKYSEVDCVVGHDGHVAAILEQEAEIARLVISANGGKGGGGSFAGSRSESDTATGARRTDSSSSVDDDHDIAFFCVLQPIFAGVEAIVKNVAFHITNIAARADRSTSQKAKQIFSLVANQLGLVGEFAKFFAPEVQKFFVAKKGGSVEDTSSIPLLDGASVTVHAYSHAIDALLLSSLIAPAAADPIGLSPIGIFDAFGDYAGDVLANVSPQFLLPPLPSPKKTTKSVSSSSRVNQKQGTAARSTGEPRLVLPGAVAVLGYHEGEVLLRASEVATQRLNSLLFAENDAMSQYQNMHSSKTKQPSSSSSVGIEGVAKVLTLPLEVPAAVKALEVNKAPWRHEYLIDVTSSPMPTYSVSQAGRVVASFSKCLRLIENVVSAMGVVASEEDEEGAAESPECVERKMNKKQHQQRQQNTLSPQRVAQIGGNFVVKALRQLAEHLNQRLEHTFELDEDLSLTRQVIDHLQVHLDMDTVIGWGEEWLEMFDNEPLRQEAVEAIDSILLDRDRCLRSLSSVLVRCAEGVAERLRSGETVGHQCQLIRSSLREVHRIYGKQSVWSVANKAATLKISHVLSGGNSNSLVSTEEDVALILSAISGGTA